MRKKYSKNNYNSILSRLCMIAVCFTVIYFMTIQIVKAETENVENAPYQYNVGSVSKTFTAIAVMKLVDEGKVDLDEPVETYIPEFEMSDERYHDITVRMLLNHSAGLMGSLYHNGTLFEEDNSETHDRLLEVLRTQKLKADPGSYIVYCNDGFTLAEILVEHVSGMDFSTFMEENICKPLGMENTTTPFLKNKTVSVPTANNYLNGQILVPIESTTEVGSGGVKSTTEDLCRLSTVLMDGENPVLSKESAAQMCKDYYPNSSYLQFSDLDYKTEGLGLDYVKSDIFEKNGIKAVGKGGDLVLQHANLTVLPKEQMSAAVLSSSGSSTFNMLVAQEVLLTALETKGKISAADADSSLNETQQQLLKEGTASIPKEIVTEYAGYYAGSNTVEVSFPNDKTMQIRTTDSDPELTLDLSYTADGFFVGSGAVCIGREFISAGDGHSGVTKVRLTTQDDGKKYLFASAYGQYAGLGMYNNHEAFGQKIEPESMSESVESAWNKRIGKKYYLYNDRFSSVEWLNSGNLTIELCSTEVDGYVHGKGCMGTKKIIDENHAESASIGRDMSTVTIQQNKESELLNIDDGGSMFISEEGMEELPQDLTEYELDGSSPSKWFRLPEELQKKQALIIADGDGAVYVYDKYDQCIYTTFAQNGNGKVLIPLDGKIVFTGEKGASFRIEM